MRNRSQAFSKFADKTTRISTPDRLCRHLESFVQGLGFTGFFYTAIPGFPYSKPDDELFLENVLLYCSDMNVVHNHMKSDFFGRGPILVRLVTGSAEPFTPYEAFVSVTGHPPPGRPEDVLDDPAIAYSLICPLDSLFRRYGVTLLSGKRNPVDFSIHLKRVRTMAYSAVVLFHERWKTLAEKAYGEKLTPRENDCLLWAAQGKTADEISTILSISERTVRFHLRNVSEKLNTVNTTHSVALAVAQGLIHL